MPANWIADNVVECSIMGRWTNTKPMVTVLHLYRTEKDAVEVAEDVRNNWQDHIVPALPNNYTFDGIRYRDRDELDDSTGFVIPDPAKALVGAGTSESAPPNCSVLVKKRITTTAQKRSGRMYLPPCQENEINEDGTIVASKVTQLNDLLSDFHSGLEDAGGLGALDQYICVVHKVESPAESPISRVTAFTVDPLLATQRRRLR